MITTLKINDTSDSVKWETFPNIHEAEERIKEYENGEYDKVDIEVLVDYSEVKKYKTKYEEIYNVLFENISDKKRENENRGEYIVFTVKFVSNYGEITSESTTEEDTAMEMVDNYEGSSQILVNIAEVKDYKEKYDEFYEFMLNNFKKSKESNKNIL